MRFSASARFLQSCTRRLKVVFEANRAPEEHLSVLCSAVRVDLLLLLPRNVVAKVPGYGKRLRFWHAFHEACLLEGMPHGRHAFHKACLPEGMPSRRHAFQKACLPEGMPSRRPGWKILHSRHLVKSAFWFRRRGADATISCSALFRKPSLWQRVVRDCCKIRRYPAPLGPRARRCLTPGGGLSLRSILHEKGTMIHTT